MEERRQVFLDASVRNPYFKYSLGTTIALLVLAMLYSKQWIDYRRTMWITAEMMTDLYNHDLYSRDVAEKAIQKYNQHIERCNRAIEAAQHGSTLPAATADADLLNAQLQKTAGELNLANTENAALQEQLTAQHLRGGVNRSRAARRPGHTVEGQQRIPGCGTAAVTNCTVCPLSV